MPILPNRAQITFSSNGASDTVLSNQTNTNLVNQFTINVTKDDVAPTVLPGSDAVYVIRMDNTGAGTVYNPVITDNLGNGALTYVENTALFFKNGDPVEGTADVNNNDELVFTFDTTLDEGDSLMVIYAATVGADECGTITNTAVGTANGGSDCGCEITDSDYETITVECVANVSIFKSASADTVSCGDTLTYTFTLMNTGSEAAEDVSFRDALPEQFNVETVSYTTNGTETPIPASDYTVEDPNTLIIPAEGSKLSISIPAATAEGPGITVITVTGTIE